MIDEEAQAKNWISKTKLDESVSNQNKFKDTFGW